MSSWFLTLRAAERAPFVRRNELETAAAISLANHITWSLNEVAVCGSSPRFFGKLCTLDPVSLI